MQKLQVIGIDSTPLSQGRAAHREWIGGRAITLLSHYWRDDDPVGLTAAIGADWADVLEGLPEEIIQRACIRYMRTEPKRKPAPGAIYQLAREIMPHPKPVAPRTEAGPQRPARVSPETAAEILQQAGFRVNRFGGVK